MYGLDTELGGRLGLLHYDLTASRGLYQVDERAKFPSVRVARIKGRRLTLV